MRIVSPFDVPRKICDTIISLSSDGGRQFCGRNMELHMGAVNHLRDQALARLLARFEQMDLGTLEHRHRLALAMLDEAGRQAAYLEP
ncbi:MAG: hypothetical protein Fur0032_13180 [Terrimicrobiaceae bacterium]